jgi:3-oxoacyl-[acyl-carrier protein] reductase
MTNSVSLTAQTAVVTGSSSGIGRAIALELARAGADVLVHAAHNRGGAEQTARDISAMGRDAHVLLADLSDPHQQDQFADAAWSWRPAHIWINNAGADVLTGDAADWTFDEKLNMLWRVDVLATVRLSRNVGQRMQSRHGTIINIGWDQADTGMEGDSGQFFAATKGAIIAFTRSLAKSLAPAVRVNCIAPGWIQTKWGDEAPDEWHERAKRDSLLARWGQPDDIARAARFLASPESEFINGQIIHLNGGRATN